MLNMWLKNKEGGADGRRRGGRGKWTALVDNSVDEVKPELSSVWVVLEPLWTPMRVGVFLFSTLTIPRNSRK